jgi:hypothetical protein
MYCRVLVATTNGGQSPASHSGGPGSQAISCDICRGQSGTGRLFYFFPVLLFSPALLFRQCPILLFIYMLFLAEGRTGEDWEPFKSGYLTEIWEH